MNQSIFHSLFSEYNIPLHGVRLPEFQIDKIYKERLGLKPDCDNFFFLKTLCFTKLEEIYESIKDKQKEYENRVAYELTTIKELGFVDYILLVWDVANYCHENNIPLGLSRGSSASSLVLYLIGVTKINPLKYDLYFERFISKIRAKKQVINGVVYLDSSLMCDIDIDVCYYNRPRLIKHLEEKFKGKTCKVSNLSTLQSKILIKECGKVVRGLEEQEMKHVATLIPERYGHSDDIKETKEKEEEDKLNEFKSWCEKNKDAYEIGLKLRGLIRHKSVHASALLISYDKAGEDFPIEITTNGELVCAYDMDSATKNNVKLDLLGLRAVSVVNDVCKQIGLNIEDINVEDPLIYQNLQDLKTPHGIFQIEAEAAFRGLQKIKPKNLNELAAVLAICRPGALQFLDKYALYTNTGTLQSVHSFFDNILNKTGGICIFQEQLMQMLHAIGFTLDEAEIARKIVGKKEIEKVGEWKKKIQNKVKENDLDKEIGEVLWKILEDSANYSFNKSHAFAYASLSAITTYLKFKYPQNFYLALLRNSRHESKPVEEIAKINPELIHFGIKLLPPHLIKSDLDFTIEGKDIRFGLLSIKGISDKSIEKLSKFRNAYSNKFEIFHAAEQTKLGLGVLCSLIQAGTLEGYSEHRCRVVLEAQLWNLLSEKEKKYCFQFGEEHYYNLCVLIKALQEKKDEKGRPLIKESRVKTIKKHYNKYVQIYDKNRVNMKFCNWWYERSLLGYSYNSTLKEIFSPSRDRLVQVSDISNLPNESFVDFMAVVSEVTDLRSKKGNRYLKLNLNDETGSINALIFNTESKKKINECKEKNGKLPAEENIVYVKGIKKDDVVFANKIIIEDEKVYTRLKDIETDIPIEKPETELKE